MPPSLMLAMKNLLTQPTEICFPAFVTQSFMMFNVKRLSKLILLKLLILHPISQLSILNPTGAL